MFPSVAAFWNITPISNRSEKVAILVQFLFIWMVKTELEEHPGCAGEVGVGQGVGELLIRVGE